MIQNADVKAADLQIPVTRVMLSALDWYSSEPADPYRPLPLDELPKLPSRPEMTNWPSTDTTASLLVDPNDFSRLEQLAREEQLPIGDLARKAVICYLFSTKTDELDINEIHERGERDEYGFRRPDPPLDDPRDIGY